MVSKSAITYRNGRTSELFFANLYLVLQLVDDYLMHPNTRRVSATGVDQLAQASLLFRFVKKSQEQVTGTFD